MANLLIYILSVLDFVIEFFVKQISKNKRLYTLVIRFQFIVNISSSLSTFHRDETIYCKYYFWHIIQELGVLSLLFLQYTLGSTASFVSWSNKLFSIEDSKAGLTLICLSDRKIYGSNGIQSHIHLVRKWTLNQLASLAKWLSVCLWTKWLCVQIPLLSLKLHISRLFRVRSSLTFRQLWSVDSLWNTYETW